MAVQWNDQLTAQMRAAAMRGVVTGTELVRNEALNLILRTAKSGRIYRRRGVEHQASAPGEAPANDTGNLVRLIRTEYEPEALRGTVQSSAKYAAWLEYGTSRMEPRPYMRPALENKRAAVEEAIMRAVRRALGQSNGR